MFTTGFMNFSFQTVGTGSNDNGLLGGIMTPPYGYHSPHKREQELAIKIRKEKTELQKLDSVLEETGRKQALISQNRIIAKENKKKEAAIRLAKLEQNYLEEIKRLLAVRAVIMQRVREDEAILIILMMKRRRLRVA